MVLPADLVHYYLILAHYMILLSFFTVFSETICPDPNRAIQRMNGYIDNYIDPPYFVGVNLTFRCEGHRRLTGAITRQCLPNGRWSGMDTVCTETCKYLSF